jgi:hypothetical protein
VRLTPQPTAQGCRNSAVPLFLPNTKRFRFQAGDAYVATLSGTRMGRDGFGSGRERGGAGVSGFYKMFHFVESVDERDRMSTYCSPGGPISGLQFFLIECRLQQFKDFCILIEPA